jgi:hypothetical protein
MNRFACEVERKSSMIVRNSLMRLLWERGCGKGRPNQASSVLRVGLTENAVCRFAGLVRRSPPSTRNKSRRLPLSPERSPQYQTPFPPSLLASRTFLPRRPPLFAHHCRCNPPLHIEKRLTFSSHCPPFFPPFSLSAARESPKALPAPPPREDLPHIDTQSTERALRQARASHTQTLRSFLFLRSLLPKKQRVVAECELPSPSLSQPLLRPQEEKQPEPVAGALRHQ